MQLIERLRSLAEAYPEDVFPALTKEQIAANPSVITRASASMGRHFSKVFAQAADELERVETDAENMLRALRVAVIALAHASEADATYLDSYESVSSVIAEVAVRYDHER